MGWTSYHATHYKNGRIDRKAECDAYFMEGLNRGYYNVLKSSMVGSTYYAAVQQLVRYAGENENGERQYEPIPENERDTFGVIFLTSTDSKDYFDFSYKDMTENYGPYEANCPKGILDLLSPTENEFALQWRAKCRENLAKRRDKNSLSALPVGSVIKVTMPFDTRSYSKGDCVILTKRRFFGTNRTKWENDIVRFVPSLMKQLDGHYEIIKRGDEQ